MPEPTGEYAVGTKSFSIYNDREEILESGKGGMRSIASRVYYPAEKESVKDLPKCRYMSREMAAAMRSAFFVPINYDKLEKSGENISYCYENIPSVPDKKFPLIIFNHGYQSYRESNSFLCIELASHGYVVVSVTHSYECLVAEFDDGTCIKYDKKNTSRMYNSILSGIKETFKLLKAKGTDRELAEGFDESQRKNMPFLMTRVPEWEKDVQSVISYCEKNFADMIDFEKGIGATGHSFGGPVAFALCLDDPRFVCGANMDGAFFGDFTGKVQDKPFLQISCEANRPVVTRAFIDHRKPAYQAVLKGMKHLGFSDMKNMIPIKSQVGSLDPDIAHELVSKCHLEFFDTYIKGIKDKPVFPESEFLITKEYEPDI